MPSENSGGTARASRSIIARKSSNRTAPPPPSSPPTPLHAPHRLFPGPVGGDAHLGQRVSIPYRHGGVRGGVAVHGDPERCAGFVLPPVAAPDRPAIVVKHIVVPPQL